MSGKIKRSLLGAGLCAVICCGFVAGCSVENTSGTKVGDLTYVIVEEDEIPEELMTMIEEKKAADFKMTYEPDDAL